MTKFRTKILYFFDNISKKDYKLKELEPELYKNFIRLSSWLPESITYSKKISIIRDINKYILFFLIRRGEKKLFVEYCKKHKIFMNNNQLNYYNVGVEYQEFYKCMHNELPVCVECKQILHPNQIRLYTHEENMTKFCSSRCQKENYIQKIKQKCLDNNSELVNLSTDSIFSEILCSKCGEKFSRNTSNIFTKSMYQCNRCLKQYSKNQLEVFDFIKMFDADVKIEVRNIINNSIIDIYSEKFKIAIEYDGLMYHSFGFSSLSKFNNINIDKNIHLKRQQDLLKQGIRLFRIWDIEWLNPKKKEIWKSVLQNAFKGNQQKIYARKCKIIDLPSKEARVFLNENHLQSFAPANLYYGLEYNGELVSVMTFGKSVRSKGQWELLRFCNKINMTVVGAASKLLSYFEKSITPVSIISYANKRWSTGEIYKTLDFKIEKHNTPAYFYFLPNYDRTLDIFHRTKFTKSNIEKYSINKTYNISIFNPEETEFINMFKNNYRIIFDCGNIKFIKTY